MVGGDFLSPLSSLSLRCLNLLCYVFQRHKTFSPVLVLSLLLTDNSGSRVPSNGSNQLASRVPRKEMTKGKKSLKENPEESPKESPKEASANTRSAHAKDKKMNKKVSSSSSRANLPALLTTLKLTDKLGNGIILEDNYFLQC